MKTSEATSLTIPTFVQLLVLRRRSRIKLIEVPRRTKIKAVRMMVISLFSWSGAGVGKCPN